MNTSTDKPLPHVAVNDQQALENAGLRVSAVRLLVWRTVRHEMQGPFSLADVQDRLPTVDRSTVFRSLVAFTEAHLLHEIDDGSGTHRYCVCHLDNTRHCQGHVHITCRVCHRTMCLTNVTIPPVPLPQGFEAEQAEYVVKGVCAQCFAQHPLKK